MAPEATALALAHRLGLPPAPWLALIRRCGVADPEAWLSAGEAQLALLEGLPGAASLRWGLWLPLFSRVGQLLARGERLVLGVNGPIGSGKTTLMAALSRWADAAGLAVAVASIDDAYLGWEQRRAALAGNPFGVWRGPPGSHDVELLLERLAAWRAGGALVLPRFDKRLRQGQGDRSGLWRGTPQLLLLEGWLLGCRPLSSAALSAATVALAARPAAGDRLALSAAELAWLPLWNQRLVAYQPLWDELEAVWVLRPSSWHWPRRWRFQAEARQRRRSRRSGAGGATALTAAELAPLVRACLLSLPPEIYQDPLVLAGAGEPPAGSPAAATSAPGAAAEAGAPAEAVVVLDSRRRCRWSGPAEAYRLELANPAPMAEGQPSASASSSATG